MKQFLLLRLLQKNYKLLIIYFVFLCFFSNTIFADTRIVVNGNINISSKTIESLAPKNIDIININLINDYQKKLYETGFFEKVIIKIRENSLLVNVVENPLVNFFYLEGIKNKEINNKILDLIKIKENTIFQPFLIKQDLKNISNFLKNIGYLKNEINYKLLKINESKVNLFYNVNLNEKFKINRIFFIGNKFFKSSTLSDVIYSSEHGWWKFLSNSTTPSESIINYDISRLKKFYLDNGFYDVQINSHSIKLIDNKYANISYSIDSGKKYFIGNIELDDKSNFLKKENILYLKKEFKDLSNKQFNKSQIDNFLIFANDYLVKSNFDLIIVEKLFKNDANKIDLKFFVFDQPNKKIINKITVIGNNITDDNVVRNNLNFSEGDTLVIPKLNASVEKLRGNGLFKNVITETKIIDENKVDIEIKVEEQATGEISAGAGAGTGGATISGGINEKNFLGRGLRVNSNINIGTQKIFGSLNYSDPDFNNSNNEFRSSFFIENNDYTNASYENKLIGTSASITYEVYDKFFLSPGISIDYDSVTANTDAATSIKRREGDYYTSKMFYDLTKNTKNREIGTTEGYTFGIGQGLSILSSIPYINNSVFGSYYKEYMENFVGSIKYKVESINGFNKDIKFSDRLFVSSNNLRGFSSRGIGPKIDDDFIGGNYLFYTTFSSTIPNGLPEKWNAATNVYFDSENLWGVDDDSTNESNKVRTSIGVGLSWISPLGPISLTYAEAITKSSTDELERFNFKIGSAF